jgi:hypothetical protein
MYSRSNIEKSDREKERSMILQQQEVDFLAEMFGNYIYLKLQGLEELSNPFSNKQTIHFIDKARTTLCKIDLGMRVIEKIMQEVEIDKSDNSNPEPKGRHGEDNAHD